MKFKNIKSKNVQIGIGCSIHETVEIFEGANVIIGDHCVIGPGVKILPGVFTLGDYSKIHDRVNINPKNYVKLGHLSWFGQGCIIDGTGGLNAGNFLGAGINSCLYSHIRHGDITEGCRYDMNKELIIGDDVWFVGMCLVSPVKVESKSIAFLGSTIVKNMDFNRVYAGNPAKDITSKVGEPWKNVTLDEKVAKLNRFIEQFCKIKNVDKDQFVIVEKPEDIKNDGRTYYNILDRTFSKTNEKNEVALNKWLFPYKCKFSPINI